MNHATAPLAEIERTLERERGLRAQCSCVDTTVPLWCGVHRKPWSKTCDCPCHEVRRRARMECPR